MYENNADDYVHKYMGIALKRRDNAPIVKTIFGGAMKMLLNARDVAGAFQFVKNKCMELIDGKVSLGQLTITKSLRAEYADPSRIAHKALADRIAARDPGNAPAAGDRIAYVYISPKSGHEASKLQGDRIETTLFIKENGLHPDYKHYIEHQLMNPISQAFGLLLEQIPGFKTGMVRGCPTAAADLDKYLAIREAKAADLLFSDCLRKLDASGRRSAVVNMFGGRAIVTTAAKTSVSNPITLVIEDGKVTVAKPKATVQTTMSSYMMDAYLLEGMKKNTKAKAAAEKKAVTKIVKGAVAEKDPPK
jgi:hypothetical protein